jgi:DNA-dependent protein kinase catalytic subunit
LGHLANPLSAFDPEQVKGICQLFLDNGSVHLNASNINSDDTITAVPSLLEAFAQVLAKMNSVDASSRVFISKCSIMAFKLFPTVYPKLRPVFIRSLHQALMILANHSDGLKHLIDDIFFHGLLEFVSPSSSGTKLSHFEGNSQTTQASLLSSLVGSFSFQREREDELPNDVDLDIDESHLRDEENQDCIRDAVMRQLLRIVEELSIGYRPVLNRACDEEDGLYDRDDAEIDDDASLFGSENSLFTREGVAPSCLEDMRKFVRLSELLGFVFTSFPIGCLQKWLPSWIEMICSRIASYPLVTSLYTLLKHIFVVCQDEVLTSHQERESIVPSLQLAVTEIFERSIQFRDLLFKTTLLCLLNAPAIALSCDIAVKVLSRGLAIGLSDPNIAKCSLNALSKWWEVMPDWAVSMSPLLAQVQFYITPSVSKKFNSDDVATATTEKLKIKDPKRYQTNFQQKVAVEQIDTQIVQLAIFTIGKYGPCASHLLMRARTEDTFECLHTMEWSLCEVEIPTYEKGADPVLVNLDVVAPRAAFLALNGATRQIRANGAELFHAICSVLVTSLKASSLERHAKMIPKYLKICVKLASDDEQICQKLFRPLVRQIVNFSIVSNHSQILVPRILDILFEVVVSAEDASQRQTSSSVIAEFIGNAAKIYDSSSSDISMLELGLRRVKAMLESPSASQRLSACEIVNNRTFYVPFREHPRLLSASIFCLYMMEGCLKCLKLACRDDPVLDSFSAARLALHRFERLISNPSLFKELLIPHVRRLGPPNITLSLFLSQYSTEICCTEKRYRDKLIRIFQKYGGISSQIRSTCFNQCMISSCFQNLGQVFSSLTSGLDLLNFHSLCGSVCAFYDIFQYFYSCDANVTLKSKGSILDLLTTAIAFITEHSSSVLAESTAVASRSPRFVRSARVQLSFVVYCTSKFLASHSFVRDDQEFVRTSLRLCLIALLRPESLGLSISGGRTLKIDTPNQIILAAKASEIVKNHLDSQILLVAQQCQHLFETDHAISKALADLLLGISALDQSSITIDRILEPIQAQRILHQILALEYSCSPRAISFSTSIVSSLSHSSKFADYIIDCICQIPPDWLCGTLASGALFFSRFSSRLSKFITQHSKHLYSSLACLLTTNNLKQAACVLELINHSFLVVKAITSSDLKTTISFVQDAVSPLHSSVKTHAASDFKMQHLCAQFVHRIFHLHPNFCDEISLQMASCLFDILMSILFSRNPDKSVVNETIATVLPFFLSSDSPLNVKVKEYVTDCFKKIGSLKVIQDLPPDDLRKLEAHNTIMSIFDCISNSRWHGIIESAYCVYIENVALCEKLNLALSFLLSNLPDSELIHVHSNFIRLVSSRESKSATQQYLRLQLCKFLWPLLLSASADNIVVASDIHSSAWGFIGSALQGVNNFKETEISSLDIAVGWLCSFQMLETAYRLLPKEKLFFRPQDMEQKKFSLEIMKSLAKARRDVSVGTNVQLRYLPSLSKDLALSSHNAFVAYICCTQSSEDVFNKNIFRCSTSLLQSLLSDLDMKFRVEVRFEVHKSTLQNLQSRTSSLQLRPQALKIHFSDTSSMILDAAVVSSQSLSSQYADANILSSSVEVAPHRTEINVDVEMDCFAQTGVIIPILHALDTASRMFQDFYSKLATNDEDYFKCWIADWVAVMGSPCDDSRIRLFYAKVVVLRPKFFEIFKHKRDFCAALCSCCELATRQFHPDECSGPSFNYFVRDLCALLGDWYAAPFSSEAVQLTCTTNSRGQVTTCECLQGLINQLIPVCIFPKASIWKSNIGFIEIFARICSGHWRVNFDSLIQSVALLSQTNIKRSGESFSVFDSTVMTFVHVIDLSLQYAHPQSSCSERCVVQFVSIFENFLRPENSFNLNRKLREALFELASIIHHKLPHLDFSDMRLSIVSKAPLLIEILRQSLIHLSNSGREDDQFICYLRKGTMFCPDLLPNFKAQASVLVTKVQGDLRYCILETFQDYFKASKCNSEASSEMLREVIPHFHFLLNSLDSKAQLLVFEIIYSSMCIESAMSSTDPSILHLRSWVLSIVLKNSHHVMSKKPRLKMLEVLACLHIAETCDPTERVEIEGIFKLDISSPHIHVQIAARKFWIEMCKSQRMNDRLEVCVNHMFDPANCSSWLSSTVAILMQCLQDDSTVCVTNKFKIKSHESDLKAFPALSSNSSDVAADFKLLACSFGADHSTLVHGVSPKSTNIYTLTQGDGPILSQLNASQQGMDNLEASSMNTMDIYASSDTFVSVLKKPKIQNSHRVQKFPLRFQGSDPDEARKIAIRLARKRTESLFQNVEDAKRLLSEPEMLRRYREDDVPDQELSLSDIMKPLVASCLCDETIASIMFCTLMKYQSSNLTLRGKKRAQDLCLFHSLQDTHCIGSVHKILETASAKESSLVGCLIQCFLEHQLFCLSVETVVRSAIRCGVVRIGVAYLEGSIVHTHVEHSFHPMVYAKKSDRQREDDVEGSWDGLIKLYADIADQDSLLAAYDMSEEHSDIKHAFSDEASGYFESALQFYASNSHSQQAHIHRGVVNCLQSLGRWDEAALEFQKNSSTSMGHCDRNQTVLSMLVRADSASLILRSNICLAQSNQFACELERTDLKSWQMLRDDATVALLNFDTKELAHTKYRINEALSSSSKQVLQLVSCEASKGSHIFSQLFRFIQVLESAELLASSKISDQSVVSLEQRWTNRLKNATCDFAFFSDVISSSRYLFLKLRSLRPGLGSQAIYSLSSFLTNVSKHIINLGHSQYGMSLVREALSMVKELGCHPPAEMLICYAHAVTRVEFMQRSSNTASSSSSCAVATVSQIKNLLSEFNTQRGANYDLSIELILFRHLESLVASGTANDEERTSRIHSAYHDLVPSLIGIDQLPSGMSQSDICSTHEAIISWLSVQLSSSSGQDKDDCVQLRDGFVSQVINSVSEIMRYSGEAGAAYIPLAIQLAIESCDRNHLSPAIAAFRECAPSFESGCCKWLSQILAEYQSALLKNCTPVCGPLECLLFKICTINPQAMFFAVSITIDSALVFLPAFQFSIVSNALTAILNRIPNTSFYKRFVSELQSMVDPDQLWSSVSKICQEMFNSNLQEQSFQYINKHLERWNDVHHWKSQSFCRKYDNTLQKISFPVNSSNFAGAQSLLRSLKDVFQAPKVNAQGLADLSSYSTFLSEYDGLRSPQKIVEFSTMCCSLESQMEVFRFKPDIWIAKSKTRPKKFALVASDGVEYSYLCKGTEDLRQDQRVSQLFSISQKIMDKNAKCRSQQLKINYYSVYPLTIDFGIVEWMNSAASLVSFVKAGFPAGSSDPVKVIEQCITTYMSTVLDNKVQNGEMLAAAVHKSASGDLKTKMEKISAIIPEDALRRGLHAAASSIMTFHHFRHEFSRTVAASSAVQWILGIGDRHAENNLLSKANGGLLPIDFGIAFGDGTSRLPIPELMPFRLSPQMQFVFAPLQAKFILRRRMASVFSALREKSSEILSLCEVFVKDRLLNIASLGNSRDSFQEEGALLDNIRHDISALQLSLTQRPSLQKYLAMKTKLKFLHPGDQIVELLESNPHLEKQMAIRCKLVELLQPYCRQGNRSLSPLEYSDLLLDMAMDFRLTGIAFRGWQAWM